MRGEVMKSVKSIHAEQTRRWYRKLREQHPIYPVWVGLMYRTGVRRNYNPKDAGRYDASLTPLMDEMWRNFSAFEAWAMDAGWKHGLQIDRIDSSLGYGPSNCRFVTAKDNRRNCHDIFRVTVDGASVSLAEVWETSGSPVNYYTVKSRVKRGWPLEKALNKPARALHRRSAHD